MNIGAQELLSRAMAPDPDGVVAVLRSMTEAQRRTCAKDVLAARDPALWGPSELALPLVEFGVLGPSQIRPLTWLPTRWHPVNDDPRYEEILRLRPREWRQRLLDRANWRLCLAWPVAYRTVRDGLAQAPTTWWYAAASVHHVAVWEDDPVWLAGDFWRIFTTEEAGHELSQYVSDSAAKTYRTLAESGRVPRDELLRSCLDALQRDFASRATPFYRKLFEALKPAPAELRPLVPRLINLLSSENRLDVGLALPHLGTLQQRDMIDPRELLDGLAPVLTAPTKKLATAAVSMVAGCLAIDLTSAVRVLSEALFNPRVDVQKMAFDSLAPHIEHLDADTRAMLIDAADTIDPMILAALGNSDLDTPAEPEDAENPAALLVATDLEVAIPPQHLPWVRHAPDGWGSHTDAYARALVERVHELDVPPGLDEPLLTATRSGGWIDPLTAAQRLWRLTGTPAAWDLAQMILRLAPDTDGTAYEALRHLDSEESQLVLHALGHDAHIQRSPVLAAAWKAADAVRDPAAYEAHARPAGLALLEERKNTRGRHRGSEPPVLPDDPITALEAMEIAHVHTFGWLATIWPSNREPMFRHAIRWLWRLSPDDDKPPRLEQFLAFLPDPRAPAGPDAGLAFAMSLNLRDIGLRNYAADTIITAITHRVVGSEWLGNALIEALQLYRGVESVFGHRKPIGITPNRWAPPLDDIAHVSTHHARVVHQTLEALLGTVTPRDRTRVNDLIALLRQLAIAHHWPVQAPNTRRFLSQLDRSSVGGRLAADILKYSPAA